MTKSLRIIYMAGGADYTIFPLERILKSKHRLVHVFTKNPKPSGRGKKIYPHALLNFLVNNNLPYSMPSNYKCEEIIRNIKVMSPDLILVFSFGHILPEKILKIPRLGCLNIHASLLPKWRGPSPVQYVLLNNETETGFTIMIMNNKVDHGKILHKEKVIVDENDNTSSLLNKITELACKSIIEIINKYSQGDIKAVEQDHKRATYTSIIKKNETYIDFNNDADSILAKVRAYNPNPGAKCYINKELIKIIEAKKEYINNKNKTGIIIDNKLLISCRKDAIRPSIIQRSGKKPLKLDEALNGWKVVPGTLVKSKIE